MAGILIREWKSFISPSFLTYYFSIFLFFLFFPFLFFEKKAYLFGAGSSPRLSLRGLSTYNVMGHIHLLFCHLSSIHVYSLLSPTSHIYYLSFTICRFRVDTTLIWITISRAAGGGEGRFFLSFFFLF